MENGELLPGLPRHLAMHCLVRASLTSLWGVCNAWREVLYTSDYFQRIRSDLGMPLFHWLYTLVHSDDGVFRWFAYDPLASTWHPLPPMPDDVDFQLNRPGYLLSGLHTVQCVSTGRKLVVVAGSRAGSEGEAEQPALDRLLVFEAEERRWSRGAAFNVPRKWCVCGVVDNNVYVASGCGVEWDVGISKSAEMYDVEAQTWRQEEPLGSSQFSGEAISAVTVGSKLHLVSGTGITMKEAAIYDPVRKVWSRMSPGLRSGWTGPCVGMSGRFYGVEKSRGRLKVYDPRKETWDTVVESKLLVGVNQVGASGGKICGIIAGREKKIVVVDVTSDPHILEVETPMGRPISIQVVARMGQGRDEGKVERINWQ